MNAKQFTYHMTCWLFDRYKILRSIIKTISFTLFPVFNLISFRKKLKNQFNFRFAMTTYIIIFLILFVVNAIWSFINNRFYPDSDPNTRNFLEDYENLINYVLVCEFYVLLGLAFMSKYFRLERDLAHSGLLKTIKPNFKFNAAKKWHNLGWGLLFLLSILASSSYANDITHETSVNFWFMQSGPPSVSYSRHGFYYFFTNFCLMFFVIWIALSFFGFIAKMGIVASSLKRKCEALSSEELKIERWGDEDYLKKILAPISILLLILKAFVITLILNAVLWNINEQNNGLSYLLMVFVLFAFGVWLFNLPRYYIQFHIFRMWKKMGKLEYKNFNIPWVIGLSSILDIVLFAILLKKLVGSSVADILKDFF